MRNNLACSNKSHVLKTHHCVRNDMRHFWLLITSKSASQIFWGQKLKVTPKFNLLLALVVAKHVAEDFMYDVLGFVDFLLADLRNPFHGPDSGILVPWLLIFVKTDGHHLRRHFLGHGMYVQKFPPDFRVHFLRTDIIHIQSLVEDSFHKRQWHVLVVSNILKNRKLSLKPKSIWKLDLQIKSFLSQ